MYCAEPITCSAQQLQRLLLVVWFNWHCPVPALCAAAAPDVPSVPCLSCSGSPTRWTGKSMKLLSLSTGCAALLAECATYLLPTFTDRLLHMIGVVLDLDVEIGTRGRSSGARQSCSLLEADHLHNCIRMASASEVKDPLRFCRGG